GSGPHCGRPGGFAAAAAIVERLRVVGDLDGILGELGGLVEEVHVERSHPAAAGRRQRAAEVVAAPAADEEFGAASVPLVSIEQLRIEHADPDAAVLVDDSACPVTGAERALARADGVLLGAEPRVELCLQ